MLEDPEIIQFQQIAKLTEEHLKLLNGKLNMSKHVAGIIAEEPPINSA